MSPPNESDLRTQILENLLQRVREDRYPSTTVLDMIESLLPGDDVQDYARILFDKVSDVAYPSMDLLRRLHTLVQSRDNSLPAAWTRVHR